MDPLWLALAQQWAALMTGDWSAEGLARFDELVQSIQSQYESAEQIDQMAKIQYDACEAEIVQRYRFSKTTKLDPKKISDLVAKHYPKLQPEDRERLDCILGISEEGLLPNIRSALTLRFLMFPELRNVIGALDRPASDSPEYALWTERFLDFVWEEGPYWDFHTNHPRELYLLRLIHDEETVRRLRLPRKAREELEEMDRIIESDAFQENMERFSKLFDGEPE